MRKFTVQLDDIRVRNLSRPDLTDSARVLLSAYNGYRFPFDVSDLALLDEKHTELVLNN
jgi:hypothetical protein